MVNVNVNVNVDVIVVDYLNQKQAQEMAVLMDAYAIDPMGGGKPLPERVKNNLVKELAKRPYAFSVMSYVEGKAAGLVTCFEMFSTFNCQPLVNVHDVIVLKEYRGLGLNQKMLKKVEAIAVSKGCCKLTLEVLDGNKVAQQSYIKFGFAGYVLDPKMGNAVFWQKVL